MFLRERIQQFHKSVIGDLNYHVTQLSPCREHMVVTLIVGSAKTRIQVEISSNREGIRATSVLCLLGLGLGLGSLLVYRFCTRLFSSSSRTKTSSSRNSKGHKTIAKSNGIKPVTSSCSSRVTCLPVSDTACNSGSDSEKTSPEETIDSGISSSSSTNTMGNISSSPDTSQSVFYSTAEGVRFRGPGGPGGERRGSTDSDGFVHVPILHHHGDDDGESGVSLMSTSPESEEINKLLSQDSYKCTGKYKHLHIDIPHGHNSKMAASTSINSLDESDAGLGFSPTNSVDLLNGDNVSESGHSMMANFSPVSLHERNMKLGPDDSLSELDKSSCRRVPPLTRNRQHSTPLSDSSRSMSSSSSVPEDLKTLDDKAAEANKRLISSHSSYSLGFGDSFDQSSINDSSRSQSVELSDNLSGIATPDSDFFNPGDIGLQTQEGMSNLECDLKEVQQEISELSEKIYKMCSRENINIPSAVSVGSEFYKSSGPKSPEVQKAFNVLCRHKHNSSTEGSFRDEEAQHTCDKGGSESGAGGKNSSQSGEFMWDYRSDLNAEHASYGDKKKFHNNWVTLDANSQPDLPSGSSSSRGDIQIPVPSQSPSINSFADLTPDSSQRGSVSVNDFYIDDGFSGLASRTDSKISWESLSVQSGSFPSSLASSAHTSPRHLSPHDAFQSSAVAADTNPRNIDLDSSNNNAAEENEPEKEDFMDGNTGENVKTRTVSPQKTVTASLDTNRNPTVIADHNNPQITDILNVGPKIELTNYVEQEWKGTTQTAITVNQGYKSIPERLGKHYIRRIRGDNYCAIRASVYQCLVNEIDITNNVSKHINLPKDLSVFTSNLHGYLEKWGFGCRMKVPSGQIQTTLQQFVDCLFRQVKSVKELSGISCKEELISALLNNKQSVDLQMMEATKALMMLTALKVHQDYRAEKPVPTFVWLMFARDTSLDPKSFFENHLNPVGDAAGLEQVEMFLLAYTLGINIEVVRPSQYGKEDFITNFVDDTHDGPPLPKVLLIAEDDRHYNVLV